MYNSPIKKGDNSDAPTGFGPILPVFGRDTTTLRQQIFEYVRAAGRAARADVTRALGISVGSATTLTADLIARGMLREVEGLTREHGRGRPPVALEVVPDYKHVIGIKLSTKLIRPSLPTLRATCWLMLPLSHLTRAKCSLSSSMRWIH